MIEIFAFSMSLTTEQIDIVNLPLEAKLLVTAGPGTGKTHTLIARIAHLIQSNDIILEHEIIVLSFSRAAVREIRNRCAALGGNLAYVNVTTFDSYATRLLSLTDPDGEWVSEGYDGRIEHAVRAIQSGSAEDFLFDVKHIFVDEIQDLVGIRAELVKTVLQTVNCGFGLFGDPAQGIYNFQLEDSDEREIGSAALYEWVRTNYKSGFTEKKLTENHRARSKAAKTALWAGNKLNEKSPNFERIFECLVADLWGLPLFCSQKDFAEKIKKTKRKTAVLCRNNGQALMLSRKLHESSVEHTLGRGAKDRMIPDWIARVLSDVKNPRIGKASFTDFCIKEGIDHDTVEDKWRILKKTEENDGATLDLSILNMKCRRLNIPDWLNENRESQITVSSIHRAKGLEFDSVIVAACEEFEQEAEYVGEESRALYVALTRPKWDLYLLKLKKYWGLKLHDKHRWIRKGIGDKKWKVTNFEFKLSDMDISEPGSSVNGRGPSASEIQDYIATEVRLGDTVELERVGGDNRNYQAVYHILHNGFLVGKTNPAFAGDLLSAIRSHWKNGFLPFSVGPLFVEGIETVFGDAGIVQSKGIQTVTGAWLNVRVGGLGQLRY